MTPFPPVRMTAAKAGLLGTYAASPQHLRGLALIR